MMNPLDPATCEPDAQNLIKTMCGPLAYSRCKWEWSLLSRTGEPFALSGSQFDEGVSLFARDGWMGIGPRALDGDRRG